jgi:hypothetical protein
VLEGIGMLLDSFCLHRGGDELKTSHFPKPKLQPDATDQNQFQTAFYASNWTVKCENIFEEQNLVLRVHIILQFSPFLPSGERKRNNVLGTSQHFSVAQVAYLSRSL